MGEAVLDFQCELTMGSAYRQHVLSGVSRKQ